MPAADRPPATFRLLIVPGVTVDKWNRVWSERQPGVALRIVPAAHAQLGPLLDGGADAGLVRLPVDQETFHAIPLYTEATVVVMPRDHALAASGELTVADLAGYTLTQPLDDVLALTSSPDLTVTTDRPATTPDAVELVAATVGVLLVPQSLARLHNRKDVTYRVVTDAPQSSVALAWLRDQEDDELIEEMIGVVRGRTANSTRGRTQPPPPPRNPEPAKRPRRTPPGPQQRRKRR
ncbi:LysR substrate-binding domain-containing protein [Longispora albida]|uniref:LysR substrate-binding domain-containing protein n=1 Tax=Longispora albida TaxID=203523 RepID=UPI00037F7254|nr:LysR substrate-binding domain-containing protein [Longispora albida]